MAKEIINTGSIPNDHTGDGIRIAFNKTNNNFAELYSTTTAVFDKANTLASTTLANDIGFATNAYSVVVGA